MPDDPHLPSTPQTGTGGGGKGGAQPERQERGADGLTDSQRRRMARKVAEANLGLVEAGALATTGLKHAVEILNEAVDPEGERQVKGRDAVRITQTLAAVSRDAARIDTPDPSKDGLHLHLHGEMDELQKAIAERLVPGSAPRVNENGHDGNGRDTG